MTDTVVFGLQQSRLFAINYILRNMNPISRVLRKFQEPSRIAHYILFREGSSSHRVASRVQKVNITQCGT